MRKRGHIITHLKETKKHTFYWHYVLYTSRLGGNGAMARGALGPSMKCNLKGKHKNSKEGRMYGRWGWVPLLMTENRREREGGFVLENGERGALT